MKKHFLLAIVSSFSALLLTAQTNIPAIQGWSKEVKNNTYIFSPSQEVSDFTYEIKPLQTATGDIKEWLQQKTKTQITVLGLQQPAAKDFASIDVLSFKTCAALVTDNDGTKWMISSMAYKTPAGKVRYAIMKMPGKGDKEHMNIAIQHFIDLSK